MTSLRWEKKIWKQFLEEREWKKEKRKRKRKSEKFTRVLYASVITDIRTHDRWRMLDDRNTERHTRWPSQSIFKRQSQSQSILPVFCFSMLYPVVDVYATQHNIRRISRIFAFTRSYTNRQIIHPFSNKNLRRDSTTQHRPTIVLFFGHCSTVFDPYKLIIYIDIIRVVYTPTPSAY